MSRETTDKPKAINLDDIYIAVWIEPDTWTKHGEKKFLALAEASTSIQASASWLAEQDSAIDGRVLRGDGTDVTSDAISIMVSSAKARAAERARETGFACEVLLPEWVEKKLDDDTIGQLVAFEMYGWRHG